MILYSGISGVTVYRCLHGKVYLSIGVLRLEFEVRLFCLGGGAF